MISIESCLILKVIEFLPRISRMISRDSSDIFGFRFGVAWSFVKALLIFQHHLPNFRQEGKNPTCDCIIMLQLRLSFWPRLLNHCTKTKVLMFFILIVNDHKWTNHVQWMMNKNLQMIVISLYSRALSHTLRMR